MDNKATYAVMREESDKLCREFGVSVINNPKHNHMQREGGLIKADASGRYTIYAQIKHDIDLAIAAIPENFDEFTMIMAKLGYKLERRGKDLRIIPSVGKQKSRRLRSLGEGYSEEDIAYRIQLQWRRPQRSSYTVYSPTGRVPRSLYALYLHYCRLLKLYPKERPQNVATYDYLKEDKLRVQKISDEAAMMGKYGIDTIEQLREHYAFVTTLLEEKKHQRKGFRNSLRRMEPGAEADYFKAQIKILSGDIRKLARELSLCQDIAFRSAGIEEVVRLIEEPDRQKEIHRKERETHERK